MAQSPILFLLMDSEPQPESVNQPVSQVGTDCFDFEFPTSTATSQSEVSEDIVFCGKVINRETQPRGKNRNPFVLLRSESSPGRFNRVDEPVRSGSSRENWWRRSNSSGRKHRNGLFGVVKFPLQMELSDMKMRQERREPLRLPLPKLAADRGSSDCGGGGGGGENCLELQRPLKRRSQLMNALAKAIGCIPSA